MRQEGLPIILLDDPVVAYFQAEKLTAVYRQVLPRFKPRFVFLLDADEFIVTPSKDDPYAQLRILEPGSQAQYFWRTYIPGPTWQEGDVADPLRRIKHRLAVERSWLKSVIVTKPEIDMRLKIQRG